MKNSLVI